MAGAGVKGEHQSVGGTASETEIPGVQNSGVQNSGVQNQGFRTSKFRLLELRFLNQRRGKPRAAFGSSRRKHCAPVRGSGDGSIAGSRDSWPEVEPHLDSVNAEEAQDQPVTMAVATAESVAAVSAGGPRWMAVPVALESKSRRSHSKKKCRKRMQRTRHMCPRSRTLLVSLSLRTLKQLPRRFLLAGGCRSGRCYSSRCRPRHCCSRDEATPAENLSSPEVATFEADAEAVPAAEVWKRVRLLLQ